jgi:hypothetical protein
MLVRMSFSAILPLVTFIAPLAGAHQGDSCRAGSDVEIWTSPESAEAGQPLRIMAVAESGAGGEIVVTPGGQKTAALATVRRGGPPFSFAAEIPAAAAGPLRVELRAGGRTRSCRMVTVAARGKARPRPPSATAWENTRVWDRTTENFYSAWIEALFDAPVDQSLSFPSLAPVLRDPHRNFLWGHLGLREDDPRNKAIPPAEPDCADLPYYLRAYFSWKMGLPLGYRDCDRGSSTRPPRCGPPLDNGQPAEAKDALGAFRKFLRDVGNRVQSGSGRTALTDQETDSYPVELSRTALRPGTIYADPYGHVLLIVKWQDQAAGTGGRLLAVDGQPDNSVGRKRFWEGTFLYASDLKSAGPGFKAFRPLVAPAAGARPAPLTNEALAHDGRFAPYSAAQAEMTPDAFYARMAALINPRGLDGAAAYEETLSALVEQLETRVGSVDNGEHYLREHPGEVIPIPEGAKIFETVGPWEDYATPSRDMRLIIAMNVLAGLPERVQRHPELFVLGGRKPAELRAELERLHQRRTTERTFQYHRSDDSPFRLSVADALARKTGFEMAYNPNDCVEVRWAAPEGSDEMRPCHRHAPEDQRTRMTQYRAWFHEARRPSR